MKLLLLFIFLNLILISQKTFSATYPRYHLDVLLTNFNGSGDNHFTSSTFNTAFRLGYHLDRKTLAPFIYLQYGKIDDQKNFNDNGVSVNSSYSLDSKHVELGAAFYPLERKYKGLNFALTGAGVLGYQNVELPQSTSLTTISHSDKGFSHGFRLGLASEWIMKNATYTESGKFCVTSEVSFKYEDTVLFDQKMFLNSILFSIGFGW